MPTPILNQSSSPSSPLSPPPRSSVDGSSNPIGTGSMVSSVLKGVPIKTFSSHKFCKHSSAARSQEKAKSLWREIFDSFFGNKTEGSEIKKTFWQTTKEKLSAMVSFKKTKMKETINGLSLHKKNVIIKECIRYLNSNEDAAIKKKWNSRLSENKDSRDLMKKASTISSTNGDISLFHIEDGVNLDSVILLMKQATFGLFLSIENSEGGKQTMDNCIQDRPNKIFYNALLDNICTPFLDTSEKIELFKNDIEKLMPEKQNLLKNLFVFLNKVTKQEQYNNMSASYLADIFAPNLFHSDLGKKDLFETSSVSNQKSSLSFLIEHAVEIFDINPESSS